VTGAADISVIVPVRSGGERYLAAAIDSALDQTLRPREIVVVEDQTGDATRGIAEAYGTPLRCISRPHRGSAAALNAGIEDSKCDLIAFLDADDVWVPRKLELQAFALREDPALDLVFSGLDEFLSPELSGEERAGLPGPRRGRAPLKCTLLVRRRVFERIGHFDGGFGVGDFVDWYARSRDVGLRERILPDALVRRRLHPNSWSRNADQRGYARALAAAVRRRRHRPSPAG
jgi:glycosyltransferase involved in cell wall biosynthesis